jgi:hypothetical protein
MILPPSTVQALAGLQAVHRPRKDRFYERSAAVRETLFRLIRTHRNRLLHEMFARINAVRPGSGPVLELEAKALRYFEDSDWAFLDLIALAACSATGEEQIATAVAPHALLYHTLRMLDDVLDNHENYKGGVATLFGDLKSESKMESLAVAGNLIPALMLAARFTSQLSAYDLELYERTLIGMLHEAFGRGWRPGDDYRKMAEAKMGAYGMFLYRPVILLFDPGTRSTLECFLSRSFFVAQLINDLQDENEDRARGQPNFWLTAEDPGSAVDHFIGEVNALCSSCATVSPAVQHYAHVRASDLIGYCLQVVHASDQSRHHRAVPTT